MNEHSFISLYYTKILRKIKWHIFISLSIRDDIRVINREK